LWILPAIFSVLGLLIGLGFYRLFQRPSNKKNIVFLFSHGLTLISMIVIAIVIQYKDLQYRNNYANIESNHDVMKYFVNDNEEYIRIAFNRLKSEFKSPNDFDLDAFSVRKQNTIANGIQDTIYNIYFTYFLGNDKTNKYFSKVSVLSGTPTLSLYNLDTKSNAEYSVIKSEKDNSERKAVESIKEAFRQMPDSTKKMIKKVLSK
jgi:hypothetical protein